MHVWIGTVYLLLEKQTLIGLLKVISLKDQFKKKKKMLLNFMHEISNSFLLWYDIIWNYNYRISYYEVCEDTRIWAHNF